MALARRGSRIDVLEDQRAVIDALDDDADLVDIDGLDRQAVGILTREDDAGSLEAHEGWAIGKVDGNGFGALQRAAIGGGKAGEDRGRAGRAERQAADAKLAAFDGVRGAEGRTEFDVRGIVFLRIERRRENKTGERLFVGGVDPVAEIGEFLLGRLAGPLAGLFALAGGSFIGRGALDQHLRITVFAGLTAGL